MGGFWYYGGLFHGAHAEALWFSVRKNLNEGELNMDVTKILAELRQEYERLDDSILSLERLERARNPRAGRPPARLAKRRVKRGRPLGSKTKKKPSAVTTAE